MLIAGLWAVLLFPVRMADLWHILADSMGGGACMRANDAMLIPWIGSVTSSPACYFLCFL
jgi:hypothetical protein